MAEPADTSTNTRPNTVTGVENDLPLCMQPGWNPETPGREAHARFLDACIAEGVDPREADPTSDWTWS